MRSTNSQCPECGASWIDGRTCTDNFHQLLAWEWDYQLLDVHHLLVLCFHLQHPSLYGPRVLDEAVTMLIRFQDAGVSPAQMRREMAPSVDSGVRRFKIRGTPEAHGVYRHPVAWTMTVGGVVAAGPEHYSASVRAWADSMLASLKVSGNLP